MRILLVDDDPDIRRLATLALARVGKHDVVAAGSGEEGLQRAAEGAFDAIVLDVMMPGLDGPGTLARLRAEPRTAGVPVVFLTAKVMPGEVARLRELGALGVLVKPFDPMGLAADLARVLGR